MAAIVAQLTESARLARGLTSAVLGAAFVLRAAADSDTTDGSGFAVGYGKETGPILGACLVQLPAVWVIGGLTLLLYGVAPRLAPAAWGVAVAVLLIGWVGPALDAPQLVLDLSPFGHLPKLPGVGMEWGPVTILLGLAVLLASSGLAGLRRRDLTS